MELSELPEILNAEQIAKYLGISRKRVYELFQLHVEFGGIPNFAIGATKRVVKADFVAWIESKRKQAKQHLKAVR